MSSSFKFEKFEGAEITSSLLEDAALLFSANYGIWGPLAAAKMGSFARQGHRIRMNSSRLKAQCLPETEGAQHVYIRVMLGDKLVGNVFATRWNYKGKIICWTTQLVVSLDFRANGLATKVIYSTPRCGDCFSLHDYSYSADCVMEKKIGSLESSALILSLFSQPFVLSEEV